MFNQIIAFSVRNKLIVVVMVFTLIVIGTYSLLQLPMDTVPDITNNQVQILTYSPSLAAEEIERFITFPIEQSVASIPGKVEVRSFSRLGLSVITVVFEDDIDIYWARQQISERLKEAEKMIPAGMGTPELAPVTTGLGEIYQYVLRPQKGYEDKFTSMDLRTIQDWVVRRQLIGTEGVADVSSFGGELKQYEIALTPDRLQSNQVSIQNIVQALTDNNANIGGAYIDKGPNTYFIRADGLLKDTNDIKNVIVKHYPDGHPLYIRDIATVKMGHAIRYGALTYNDEGEVTGGIVLMLKGANSSKVIANVKEKIKEIEKSLPEGIVIDPFVDRTKLVNNAIHTVSKNLIEGALIVIFVLVLLLGNFRAGLIVASVIPLSMLFAITGMHLLGISGNLMSLGALDFGLIVDGAVIVVEFTLHRLAHVKDKQKLDAQEMDALVTQSAFEIRNSAAFGEIIIMIVYLPIMALVGIEGKMFRPMAITVALAIMGAFILSNTYVPMMSAWFLSKKIQHQPTLSDRLIEYLQKMYRPVLKFVLRKGALMSGIAFVVLGGSLWLFSQLGGEFIPELEEGDFAVETRLLTGSSLGKTVEVIQQSAAILVKNYPDEVVKVVGKIGSSEIPTDPMPVESGDMLVILKDRSEWKKARTMPELAQKMQKSLEDVPGVTYGFQQPIQMRFNELMTGARQDVVLKIYGEDLSTLSHEAQAIAKLIHDVKGVEDLYVERVDGLPYIGIDYNREAMATLGVSIADANMVVNTAFAGNTVGTMFEGEKRFDLTVRLDTLHKKGIEDVKDLYVQSAMGTLIPLTQIASITFKSGPNQIQRDATHRRITVGFNVRDRDVESLVQEVRSLIEKNHTFHTGYFITYGGQFENLKAAKNRLAIAVPIVLLLIFLLLYFTFHSISQGILIFSAIPFATVGGIVSLWLRDMPFSISAGVGFIALFGVAVLNGIVLIGEFNKRKEAGDVRVSKILLGGTHSRLRPVIMTALVASLGFLPMAISTTAGAEVQRPLATVVIGGIISSTLLTLFLLPVFYGFWENVSKRGVKNS